MLSRGRRRTGNLEVGDVVLAVNDRPTYTACQVQSEITKVGVDQPIEVEVQRGKRDMTLQLRTRALDEENPDYPIIGIEMEEKKAARARLPEVTIDTGQIGGPSAGTMFA